MRGGLWKDAGKRCERESRGVVLRTRLALAKSFATVSVGCAPTDSLRNTRTHKLLAAGRGAAIGR